jgi:hypothetical protein
MKTETMSQWYARLIKKLTPHQKAAWKAYQTKYGANVSFGGFMVDGEF